MPDQSATYALCRSGRRWSHFTSNFADFPAESTGIGFDLKTYSVIVTSPSGCEADDEITVIFDFAACSGVDDLDNGSIVNLYPNPGNGNVQLQPSISYRLAFIDVYDPLGRVVADLEKSSGSPGQDIILDLQGLRNGIYYIRFKADDLRPVTLKYIKTK